ncbi:MAG: alpha/beta fold hydrolase [Hyphomonadaceae bacterium]|nr:alpha/beta fold hydrolase [Hyphomonadaceae bacterium]
MIRLLVLVVAAALAACAPVVQRAMTPPAGHAGARFDVVGERFITFDGTPLGLSVWTPRDRAPWAVIVAVHGMNDYGEAFYLAGPWWAQQGIATYAYDARGHGRSPQRGVWGGTRLLTQDLRTAVTVARAAHPGAVVAVVGDSMGAATAIAAFASDDPPAADRLVLVAPAVWGWSTLPKPYAATLWVGAHTFPYRAVTPPRRVQRRITASDNTEMLRKIGRDPNMIFSTRIDAVYGLVRLMEAASDGAGRLRAPTAFLYGAKDQIIPRASALRAARALPPHARTALYPDGYHMLLRDLQAETVWRDVAAFVRDPAAPFPSGAQALLAPGARETLTGAR